MGRNKYIQCTICSKNIRSDKMKCHTHSKVEKITKTCVICNKTMKAGNIARHMRTHKESVKEIKNIIKGDQQQLEKRKQSAPIIKATIEADNIDPRSLRKEHIKALELFDETLLLENTLRPWQQKLLEYITPSNREIIWVFGTTGNEGKSWFQQYLNSYFGPSRVFNTNVKKHSDGILHILSKRVYALIDVFLFNVPRSFSNKNAEHFPYELLEEIKDGHAVSCKYDSKYLRFKTPNTVVVFSNGGPDKDKMSMDRWKIFNISGGQLFEGLKALC